MKRRVRTAAALAVIVTAASVVVASADPAPEIVPAKTDLRFELTAPLSSDRSTTGQPFTFVIVGPVIVDGQTVIADGATGAGTLLLAGHNGTSGHEGDLTLRLDTVPAVDGRPIVFDDQRLRINGRNKKVMSGALSFIPFAGLGARFIRGAEVHIDPGTPIDTVLDRAASTDNPLPSPVPTRS